VIAYAAATPGDRRVEVPDRQLLQSWL
jgi:hypothetical protein